jgi:serine/threonine-protein kinase
VDSTPSFFEPPKALGRFDLLAKIAEGGMASLHLARDRNDRQLVALKLIKPSYARNPDFVAMFRDEASIVSQVRHPSVVRVVELGEDAGHLFLVMEMLHGQSLWAVWDALRERGVRIAYELAAHVGACVAAGLHAAHEQKDAWGKPLEVVHRDVNASNVMLTYDGDVKLIDFGLAKAQNRAFKTAAGVIKGKLAYMAPEQAEGKPIDRRADIFALGVTLWEITVDERLFKRKHDIDTLKAIHAGEVPDPTRLIEGYPTELWMVLRRALARNAADRFPTAGAMEEALRACAIAHGAPVGAKQVSDLMGTLFAGEKQRSMQWVEEAGGARAPLPTLHPPSTFHRDEALRPAPSHRRILELASESELRAEPSSVFAPPSRRATCLQGGEPLGGPHRTDALRGDGVTWMNGTSANAEAPVASRATRTRGPSGTKWIPWVALVFAVVAVGWLLAQRR